MYALYGMYIFCSRKKQTGPGLQAYIFKIKMGRAGPGPKETGPARAPALKIRLAVANLDTINSHPGYKLLNFHIYPQLQGGGAKLLNAGYISTRHCLSIAQRPTALLHTHSFYLLNLI